MRRCLLALIAALAASTGAAQEGDRLKSPDCRQALDALQAQEAKLAAMPQAGPQGLRDREAVAQLKTLRRQAARACLGGRGETPPLPQHIDQRPVIVPPVNNNAPAPPAPPQRPAPPAVSMPKPAAPPTVVTICDANGCWASDGSRLDRMGSNLVGPRGVCSLQGVVLQCP
jgi:hypothetical protein